MTWLAALCGPAVHGCKDGRLRIWQTAPCRHAIVSTGNCCQDKCAFPHGFPAKDTHSLSYVIAILTTSTGITLITTTKMGMTMTYYDCYH